MLKGKERKREKTNTREEINVQQKTIIKTQKKRGKKITKKLKKFEIRNSTKNQELM